MGKGSRMRGFKRNNYCHPIMAKVGTHALTTIFVNMRTAVARGRLKPGDVIKYREVNDAWAAWQPVLTAVVADETIPGGTLFLTRTQ